MKDRTREAVMNLLGGTLEDHLAFDLFGGSGVMAFESLSRGASHACVWEVLKTGAETIRGFAKELGLSDRVTVLHEDVLRWSKNLAGNLQVFGAWACKSVGCVLLSALLDVGRARSGDTHGDGGVD